MEGEKETVCMSFSHTLERSRDLARSSHLNKLHKMKKKIVIINCNNIVHDRQFFQEDLAMEYFYGHSYSSSDSKGVHHDPGCLPWL